jgi:phage shock protein A
MSLPGTTSCFHLSIVIVEGAVVPPNGVLITPRSPSPPGRCHGRHTLLARTYHRARASTSEGKWAGMSISRRIAMLFRAKANKALDRAEDPREVLDYSYEQQLEMVQKVRRGVADVATSRKRVELQVTQLQLSAGKLQDQAQRALAAGREDLARAVLIRRAAVISQIGDMQGQQASLQTEEDKLTLASQRLEAKVGAFGTRKETIKAAYTAAEAQTRIGEAVSGISEEMGDVGMAMQRAQDKTEQLQARAAALDELLASGALPDATLPGGRDDVQSELDALTPGHDVDGELARMKAQLPASAAPPAVEGFGTASVANAFGADLFQRLAQDGANMVFSPVSVAGALWMAWCGARGQTAAELARALHMNGSAAAAMDGLRSLSALVGDAAAGGSVTFRAPNTVWVQSGLPVRPGFTARLIEAAATFADADFTGAPDAARNEINRVIAEQTGGKISGLLPAGSVGPLTRLVLANAVYLKAAWLQPFPVAETSDALFYPEGQERPDVTVRMMRGTAPRAYVRGDGYQAVLLPYTGGSLAMAVIRPDGPLAALRPALAARGLGGMLAGTSRYQVTLSLPRFRVEAAFDLIPALRQLGVNEAFSREADFSGITEAEPLQISTVAHKAYVDVDEHGTEATAATAVGIRATAAFRPPPPVTMVVDRPFLFVIVHTATGLPLFAGQVSHPRSG